MPRVAQPSPKVLAARINGAKGGLARAAKLSASRRREIASMGGTKTFETYGESFLSYIGKKKNRRKQVNAQSKKG